jgi:O-antigen/teichoic acid export membrane protein
VIANRTFDLTLLINFDKKETGKLNIIILRGIGIIFQFAVIKLYALSLQPAEVGRLYFLFTISYVVNGLILAPLDARLQPIALNIWYAKKSLGSLARLHRDLILALLIFAVFCEVTLYFFMPELLGTPIALMLLAWSQFWVSYARKYLNNIGEQQISTWLFVLEPAFRAIFLGGVAYFGQVTVGFAIWSNSIALSLISLGIVTWFWTKGWLRHWDERLALSPLLKGSIPFSISGALNLLQLQGYRLILVPLGYASEVGIFALVSQFGFTATTSVGAIYTQVAQPAVYRDHEANLGKYLRHLVYLLGMIFLASIIFGPLVIKYATKGGYSNYAPIMLVGVICEGANLLIGAYSIRAAIMGRTGAMAVSAILGGIVFIIAFIYMITLFRVSPWLIGMPMVASQITVVAYLMHYYEKNR